MARLYLLLIGNYNLVCGNASCYFLAIVYVCSHLIVDLPSCYSVAWPACAFLQSFSFIVKVGSQLATMAIRRQTSLVEADALRPVVSRSA